MTRFRSRRGLPVVLLAVFFVGGMAVGWRLRGGPLTPAVIADVDTAPTGPRASVELSPESSSSATTTASNPVVSAAAPSTGNAIDDLVARRLTLPIDNADIERWKGMFGEGRDAGKRPHEAVDILAPRNTPVHAVEDGIVAKLFLSRLGGNTIYQFDPDGRFCYYYAHLERYAPGLENGQRVKRDQIIGYVGTSGNAPPDTPHLHFAIFALDEQKHWWQGRPLDPYLAFKESRGH